MRPLGKGAIIQVGCRFTKGGLPQRIDYDVWNYYKSRSSLDQWGLPPTTADGLLSPELRATRHTIVERSRLGSELPPAPPRRDPRVQDCRTRLLP
jgi:hypothetical protein